MKSNLNLDGINAGVIIKDKTLEFMAPILTKWIHINREYIEEHNHKDCMYWYNERTNVSSLAGAVWRCGGVALEESTTVKGKEDDNEQVDNPTGRIDLYFKIDKQRVNVEAKIKWLKYSRDFDDVEKLIKDKIKEADDNIRATMTDDAKKYADHGLAVTFIVPYWVEAKEGKELLQSIRSNVDSIKYSFFAWFIIEGNEGVSYKNTDEEVDIYKGVFLVGRLLGEGE